MRGLLVLLLLVGATLQQVATTEDVKDATAEGGKVEVEDAAKEVLREEEGKVLREDEGEVPVVRTCTGKISGIREKSTKGKSFYSYYGIPYAKPPKGELRFKDPEMLNGWGGVRNCSAPAPMCPQPSLVSIMMGKEPEMEGDEDCLYLNIFTPKARDKAPLLPVMVFIHGGGYFGGSALEYPPYVLLNEDIVLVTLQYRLGVLGFLSTEDDVAPGNLGLKDQTLALSWIQKSVPNFGGDPLRVTLFGESAGASSAHLQILSPKSIGLFKRAILQSGSAIAPWAMGAEHATVANYTGSLFNCSAENGSDHMISCLQKVDATELASVVQHTQAWLTFPLLLGPRVDGQFLPEEPEYLMNEARHKRVDIISGVTQNEGGGIASMMYANEMARSALMYDFIQNAPLALEFRPDDVAPLNQTVMIFDHYLGGIKLDAEHADNVTQMFSDRLFNMGHDLTTAVYADRMARYKNTTFRYELRHRGQRSLCDLYQLSFGKDWVCHADELFYFFEGGLMFPPLEREEDLRLRDIMIKLWTNFAATGNPTPDDSLGFTWDPVKHGDLKYLALQPSPAMEEDNRKEVRDFFNSLPLRPNLYFHPEKVTNLVFVPNEETNTTESAAAREEQEPNQESTTQGSIPHEGDESETQESGNKKDEL